MSRFESFFYFFKFLLDYFQTFFRKRKEAYQDLSRQLNILIRNASLNFLNAFFEAYRDSKHFVVPTFQRKWNIKP